MTGLTVVRTGPLALVQDLGRPGLAHLGVPPSGAVDRPALLLANALVGNVESAAAIEAVLGGLAVRASGCCTVAVTGALATIKIRRRGNVQNGRSDPEELPFATAVELADGDELRIGTPRRGLRCYLAVSGGIGVPATLGSRSTDVLSGLGPPPLAVHDELPLAENGVRADVDAASPATSTSLDAREPRQHDDSDIELPVLLGPRDDWFDDAAAQLREGEWTVAPSSNRIGVRLDGTPLRRADGELPTEPVVTGSVQVPPSGQPVIFLNDHPTTGGYPVVAVVHPDALPSLAQARPGYRVRLKPT